MKSTKFHNIQFIEFAQELSSQFPSETMTKDDKVSIKIILDILYRVSLALEIKNRPKLVKNVKLLGREVFTLSLWSKTSWNKRLPRSLIANQHVPI